MPPSILDIKRENCFEVGLYEVFTHSQERYFGQNASCLEKISGVICQCRLSDGKVKQ